MLSAFGIQHVVYRYHTVVFLVTHVCTLYFVSVTDIKYDTMAHQLQPDDELNLIPLEDIDLPTDDDDDDQIPDDDQGDDSQSHPQQHATVSVIFSVQ